MARALPALWVVLLTASTLLEGTIVRLDGSENVGLDLSLQAGKRYVDPVFERVEVRRGLVYSEPVRDVTGKLWMLALDLYEPQGDTEPSRPAIIVLHGGGFFGGSRDQKEIVDLATAYARRGYVAVSASYRLGPKVPDPNPLAKRVMNDAQSDVHAAIRWLRKRAAVYRIDSGVIVVAGWSAGGNLAHRGAYNVELVGSPDDSNPSNPGQSSGSMAAVDIAGGLPGNAAFMAAGDPPIVQFWGTLDPAYPRIPEAIEQQAQTLGIPSELHLYPGAEHNLFAEGYGSELAQKSAAFLSLLLGL